MSPESKKEAANSQLHLIPLNQYVNELVLTPFNGLLSRWMPEVNPRDLENPKDSDSTRNLECQVY